MLRKSVCVSHRKDVDGLASAALVQGAKGTEVLLAGYNDVLAILRQIQGVKEVYICDLGLNPSITPGFLAELDRLSQSSSVTYIDHHPLNEELKGQIRAKGVDLVHSVEECAGVLTYLKLRDELPAESFLLACYAAVTDYLDTQPLARQLMQRFDRQFILLEATMLSYAISRRNGDPLFLASVINRLAKMTYPHQIEGVQAAAAVQAEEIVKLSSTLSKEGQRMRNFAYAETREEATGLVANLLFGAFDTPVAFAYRIESEGVFEGSLRGSYTLDKNLGSIATVLAQQLGGSGGGHKKAAGVRVPVTRLKEFLDLLDHGLEA